MGNELPYGEWVPTHAVKFNHDGTVDVMTEGPTHNRGLPNIAAGFIDTEGDFGPPGHFHPIRASYDYSRKRGGDKEKKRAKPKKRAKAKRRS